MMEKYDEKAINKKCRGLWEAEGVYKFDASKSRAETFALDTPPPTVSGSLHMGHVLGYTQADILARFRRMKGGTVFFPIGWDDNGLPTERRVQNYFNIKCDPKIPYDPNFAAEHRDKFDEPQRPVSRKNFIEHCRRLIGADEKVFEDILRQMGMSYDWSLMYSTISDEAIRLAQESFIKLYGAGHVKSVDAPTMWDTGFQTAVAIAEIEDREVDGFFHDIKFGSDAGDFVISTTRPEFLPACVAVVAHPDDSRYRHLIGKTAATPLFGAKVPIFGDPHADPEKGTGIMMVCTFGDSEDVKFWKEHGLPLKQIIGRDGKIIDTEWIARKELVGLPVKAARRQIVEWLRESGDLAAEPRPIRHSVKFYEKGDTPIEFVPSRQWFVSTVGKKQALLDAADKISWTPEYMKSRFVNWTENLNQDWAISRQRFFGVPFPVWYGLDESGEPDFDHPIIAKKLPCDPATECPDGFAPDQRGRANGFVGDPDVMDTWMTSALTPKIAMAMTDAKNLDMPFDARWNGHEIIRTWDFCTILTALLNDERLPWRGLWINGFVLDKDRKKMSKSKGNVVVPHDLVEKFGSDAIRLWAASSKWGTDASADEKVMEQKRKLVVKFFNAAKFIFPFKDKGGEISNPLDAQWRSRLGAAARESGKCFASNDHAGALAATEQCFWDFCDNYLETAKGRAYGGDASAVRALHFSLDAFCKMFAPFMPFITEEAWRETHSASVHLQEYPAFESGDFSGYAQLCDLLKIVRGKKSEAGKSIKAPISAVMIADTEFFRACEMDIKNVLNAESLSFGGGALVGPLAFA